MWFRCLTACDSAVETPHDSKRRNETAASVIATSVPNRIGHRVALTLRGGGANRDGLDADRDRSRAGPHGDRDDRILRRECRGECHACRS